MYKLLADLYLYRGRGNIPEVSFFPLWTITCKANNEFVGISYQSQIGDGLYGKLHIRTVGRDA